MCLHPSHVTRISMDASTYDEICINCGSTDEVPGGWGRLSQPCSKPVGQGGITYEEWVEKEKERNREWQARRLQADTQPI